MSEHFPDVNSKQMVKVALKMGFIFKRQTGTSHAIYFRESDKRRTTIPIHGKKSIKRKTVKSICRDLDITIVELSHKLKEV
jgi:predicted RNA binding protein YcfA (HicA-like mRNA interferase family)